MADQIYISLKQYYMGRDITYKKNLTDELKANAQHTVNCTNKLLAFAAEDNIQVVGRSCNSGWRPKPINDATPKSDPNSPHVTCEGIDIGDADKTLRKWIDANPDKVAEAGFIAIELFHYSPTWCHLQTRLPLSWQKGNVIYIPAEGGWKHWKTKKFYKTLIGVQ